LELKAIKKNFIKHSPVLLDLILDLIRQESKNLQDPEFTFIDGTLGLGGHASSILKNFPSSKLIGIDRDLNSLKLAQDNLKEFTKESRTSFFHSRFSRFPEIFKKEKESFKNLRFVLLDLGISSYQLENENYGLNFAFQTSNNLDMRLDPWCKNTALILLNRLTQKELADLFWYKSEFRKSKKLARLILENRPIKNSEEFVRLCFKTDYKSKSHPATLPMMALRIAVNEEFEELETGLRKIIDFLPSQANILVISFHSGEDRIVKNIFKELKQMKILELITKKPINPSKEEISLNRRARSSKLRIAKKLEI